ncbi:MAG: hypothetical protein M0030_07750 [Actinomycetota bacterium]|nr:hypothetical protein [Actinomycetota bacterium]
MPGSWDFTVVQGATFDQTLTWKYNGSPVDLTGWSAHMQIRSVPGGLLYSDLTVTGGQITLGGTLGTIRLVLDAAVTAAFTWDSGYYDLMLTSPSGAVTCLLSGRFVLQAAITT